LHLLVQSVPITTLNTWIWKKHFQKERNKTGLFWITWFRSDKNYYLYTAFNAPFFHCVHAILLYSIQCSLFPLRLTPLCSCYTFIQHSMLPFSIKTYLCSCYTRSLVYKFHNTKNTITELVRKHMDVNEHERLSNIMFRYKLK
jgi:hypothetical protein